MLAISIRKGEERDFNSLLGLIKELAVFEKSPDSVTNSVERMLKEQDLFEFFVAEEGDKVIGAAVYFFAYYTWVGKSLYLDDLFVKSEYRSQKVGSKLLRKVFEVAKQEGCQRLRWQVLNWNSPAIEFYKKIGATVDEEWFNCDFLATDIEKFLTSKIGQMQDSVIV